MNGEGDSRTDRGREWFAGIMWDDLPDEAQEQLREGDDGQ